MEEMNTNPLALSKLPDEYLFTTAVREAFGTGFSIISPYHLRFSSQYAHIYVSITENKSADGYEDFHTQDIYRDMFNTTYVVSLRYINEVIIMTSEGEKKNPVRNAMAQIIAVVNFALATDCWGDIPYFEGAQGTKGILYPKYDKQEIIFPDMLNRLKLAIDVLKTADPKDGYPGADPVYNNDLTKWVRFANSLRLRLAMRTRFVDPVNSAKVITECMAGPFIETNDQNFELKHQDSENGELYNPWFDLRKVQNFKMSEKFTNWLISTNDPRLQILVEPNSKGERKGVLNGLNNQALILINWNSISNPMPVLYSKSLSQYLMCASETWFLRAEAALFNLASDDAGQLYQQGIRCNMLRWNVDLNSIQNFLDSEPEATLNGSQENQFRQIGTQMWIAFIPNFTEAWTNIRRTGYPVIPQRTNAEIYSLGATNGILPKRFRYPSNEYLSNRDNVTQAVSQQGPDKIDTPVWWDVREK
jgi:hypothetical protein